MAYVQMAVTTYNTSLPASDRYRNGLQLNSYGFFCQFNGHISGWFMILLMGRGVVAHCVKSMPLMLLFLTTLFSGKVQISLVWNSRNENSQNSEKLHALVNVSYCLPYTSFLFWKKELLTKA